MVAVHFTDLANLCKVFSLMVRVYPVGSVRTIFLALDHETRGSSPDRSDLERQA